MKLAAVAHRDSDDFMTSHIRRPDAVESWQAAALEARLHALETRVMVLEAAEAARARGRQANGRLLSQLLTAIVIVWDYDYPFLAEHLHEAPDPNLRFLLNGRSVKAIGKLLASAHGRVFDGRQLVPEDPVDGRRQWSVRQV
jgi:hypothetical protein